MNAAVRRAELVRILRQRKKDTIDNLARELGVSRNTIKRDLLTLTVDEGYHIETFKGNGGGVVFHDTQKPFGSLVSQEHIDLLNELAQEKGGRKAKLLNEILDFLV